MGNDVCKLCGKNSKLLTSHVIPRFVYKWMKDTSGSGYIRFAETPNQRSQDGFKLPWLCKDCEMLFNSWETEFANTIFHPMNNGIDKAIIYDQWLNLLCVSLSWRVLTFYIEQNHLKDYPIAVQEEITKAIQIWKGYLLGQSNRLGKYKMFFFPIKPVRSIEQYSLEDIPPNLNQYMLRAVDMDVAFNTQNYSFVYIKLGPFIITGFVEYPLTEEWIESKVKSDKGNVIPGNYHMPQKLFNFIVYKAERINTKMKRISKKQKDRINQTFGENLERLAESHALKALEYDIQLFGKKKVFGD